MKFLCPFPLRNLWTNCHSSCSNSVSFAVVDCRASPVWLHPRRARTSASCAAVIPSPLLIYYDGYINPYVMRGWPSLLEDNSHVSTRVPWFIWFRQCLSWTPFFLSGIALDGKKKHHFVLKQKDRVLPKGQSFLRVNAICQFERFECVPGRPSAIFQVKWQTFFLYTCLWINNFDTLCVHVFFCPNVDSRLIASCHDPLRTSTSHQNRNAQALRSVGPAMLICLQLGWGPDFGNQSLRSCFPVNISKIAKCLQSLGMQV